MEELDGTEFIYKEPAEFHLNLMQTHVKTQLLQKADKDNVILLGNSEVDRSSLEFNKVYYQVISVEPYAEQVESIVSPSEQHFKLNRFISETAFSGEKIAQEELSRQQKKKTVFVVDGCFPYLKYRLPVISKKEIVLSPIENAIELVQNRSAKIREQLECNPPRLNPLQQIIQGSVLPMVNEGPLKICETFLTRREGMHVYDNEQVAILTKVLATFVTLCGFAIALNKSLIGPKHIKFQQMVEQQYKILKQQVNEYISNFESGQVVIDNEPPAGDNYANLERKLKNVDE